MNEWSVRLVVILPTVITDAQIERLYGSLSDLHAALGQNKNGHLEAQLTITDVVLPNAIVRAGQTVNSALDGAGLQNAEIIEVEAMSWDEFDRRLDEPRIP